MLLAGNDIVDLSEAGTAEKSKDRRFMTRVFTPYEENVILTSERPDWALWTLWAAKETGYKLVSKMGPAPVFAHKKFQTALDDWTFTGPDQTAFEARLRVTYEDRFFEVTAAGDGRHIHAAGTSPAGNEKPGVLLFLNKKMLGPGELDLWEDRFYLEKCFSEDERVSALRGESAAVRYYAKEDIAARLKISMTRLQIIRPMEKGRKQPPSLLLDRRPSGINLSLSHHGHWLGWAYSVPRIFLQDPAF